MQKRTFIDEDGAVYIPEKFLRKLGIKSGQEMLLEETYDIRTEETGITITPIEDVV